MVAFQNWIQSVIAPTRWKMAAFQNWIQSVRVAPTRTDTSPKRICPQFMSQMVSWFVVSLSGHLTD
jgi:hypothetical protein